MKKDFFPKSRKDNLVVQELDGEVLIYDLQTDKAMCLNPTSALIWEACDGNRSVNEISEFVSKKLNSKGNEDLVWLALDQLKKEKLIENGAELNNGFEGMSRREVIRKVGLASAIALPMILSVVAPLAVHANSACILGGTCTCQTPNTGQGNVCTATASTCNVNCVCRFANSGNSTGVCAP